METVDRKPGRPSSRKSFDFAVTDDLAGLPVTAAELDIIEAFLMAEFRAVMAGETPANATLRVTKDWEPPQTHAEITPNPESRGARR